jgi:hypothetical protein
MEEEVSLVYKKLERVESVEEVNLDETVVHDRDHRYTEADGERESDRIAASPWPGLTPGGKSLSGGARHSPVVRAVVGQDTYQAIQARAKAEGMSVSKWIRRTLEAKLAA